MTAEAGRLGTEALIALADETGGIAVRVPSGAGPFARGTRLRVIGTLAAPYGQLEIRPSSGGVVALGSAVPPDPQPLGSNGLDEGREGQLVSAQGRLAAKPRRSAGGDLTATLERPGAPPVKVIADATSLVKSEAFVVGRVYRMTGVVGQRASKKGALDGYRLCLRDAADVVALAAVAAAPASDDEESAGDEGFASEDGAATRPIGSVKGRIDESVAIAGTVTIPATLLDSSGRRIVVQDGTGAIEVLLPSDAVAPSVGSRVRVAGTIGVAYGAPRLRANYIERIGSGAQPAPVVLASVPTSAHEWLLVRVTGRIESVRKLGERWRAELVIDGQRAVIAGQAGSGIPVGAVHEGSKVRVVGVARRANPASADQRFAVTPRFPADVQVIASAPPSSDSAATRTGAASPALGSDSSKEEAGVPDIDLVDLAAFLGRSVRVGGLITDIDADGIWLDDGTTLGLVVLQGQAAEFLGLLEIDDALNATGLVQDTDAGIVVVVSDPAGIALAGRPMAPTSPARETTVPTASPTRVHGLADPTASRAGTLGGLSDLGAGLAGIVTLLTFTALSAAVTVLRRVRARRLLEDRILTRVAALGEPPSGNPGPRLAEREPSTFHSA